MNQAAEIKVSFRLWGYYYKFAYNSYPEIYSAIRVHFVWNSSGLNQKGKERVFHGLDTEYTSVAVVSLGKKDSGFNELEELDEARESVRAGVAGNQSTSVFRNLKFVSSCSGLIFL